MDTESAKENLNRLIKKYSRDDFITNRVQSKRTQKRVTPEVAWVINTANQQIESIGYNYALADAHGQILGRSRVSPYAASQTQMRVQEFLTFMTSSMKDFPLSRTTYYRNVAEFALDIHVIWRDVHYSNDTLHKPSKPTIAPTKKAYKEYLKMRRTINENKQLNDLEVSLAVNTLLLWEEQTTLSTLTSDYKSMAKSIACLNRETHKSADIKQLITHAGTIARTLETQTIPAIEKSCDGLEVIVGEGQKLVANQRNRLISKTVGLGAKKMAKAATYVKSTATTDTERRDADLAVERLRAQGEVNSVEQDLESLGLDDYIEKLTKKY